MPSTSNPFAVERVGENSIIIGRPPAGAFSRLDALVLAAWLLKRCGEVGKPDQEEIREVIKTVKASK